MSPNRGFPTEEGAPFFSCVVLRVQGNLRCPDGWENGLALTRGQAGLASRA